MTSSTTARGLGADRYFDDQVRAPDSVVTTIHELTTADGARVTGVLRVPPSATAAVTLMHPRQDITHHALVPHLLRAGHAVWTQGSRSPNNDLTLVHEQAIIDFAAGQVLMRARGFDRVFALGHSGGGTLAAFYVQQASLAPDQRLTAAPSGRRVPLADTDMPVPEGVVFLAPHPGQGALLQRVIDPSVTDEGDPLSRDPDLDPFAGANGFAEPPASSSYDAGFVERYRAAQAARIARIDAVAAAHVAQQREADASFKRSGDPDDRRRALSPRILIVHRTDADLRNVDLSLDPNDRPYGSLMGRRPDLTDYGLVGFGRMSTAEAWMSTWSANTTNADFLRCARGVTVPTLLVEFTGDQASFPADIAAFRDSLAAEDLSVSAVRGTHFGGPIVQGEPHGSVLAAEVINDWLGARS